MYKLKHRTFLSIKPATSGFLKDNMQCQNSNKTVSTVTCYHSLLNLASDCNFLDLVILRIYNKGIIQIQVKSVYKTCTNMLTQIYNMKSWDQPKIPRWDVTE